MSQKFTTEHFIKTAKSKHGDRYCYDLVDYVNAATKIRVVCKMHGVFTLTPNNHTSKGIGCPACSGKKQHTTDEFIQKARLKHGDRYCYDLAEYFTAYTNVTILCNEHGAFRQSASKHLFGRGCPDCGGSKKSNTQGFIQKARAKHGDFYDYSLVDYVNAHTKVKIVCPKHGEFMQNPASHFTRSGCPACAENGYRPSKPGTLYYVRFDLPGLQLWKIGITNRKLKERFSRFNVKPVILWQRTWHDGNIAAKEEKRILRGGLYDQYRYNGDPVLHDGNTECFTIDIMPLDKVTRIAQASA